ncbi:MAG: SGNH/GDSL hydrolase family protein [Ktedonobacteraceae bacterium]
MLRNRHTYRRILVPLAFVALLLVIAIPSAFATSYSHRFTLVGPKARYLALGNSLAFGFQPNLNFSHGYADDFMSNLSQHGVKRLANMGCPGETSSTFINGGCPYPFLRKFPYIGPQLAAAVAYLKIYRGQVSPVTLDIGANDLLPDFNASNCAIASSFPSDLATVDANVHTILTQLQAAMLVNGRMSGDIVMMNYYDPYQNICPNTVPDIQLLNQHLAADVQGFGTIVDVFSAFGGAGVPNNNICNYTWMCSIFKDIHATTQGYSVIANAFENGTGY